MIVEHDVPVPMRDGLELRANVFRPAKTGLHPVILSVGPYGKDVPFSDGYAQAWKKLKKLYPEVDSEGTSGKYLVWELPDPERWVPHGYVVIAVDTRGSGKSPGVLDVWSKQQVVDHHDCIEWAGTQPWSNGRVGLMGISFLAVNQWQVAALSPPHLAAIMPWEGFSDFYREMTHHGGILSNHFVNAAWWPNQILSVQHGNARSPHGLRVTGGSGPAEGLSEEVLHRNRASFMDQVMAHPFDDEWYSGRNADLSKISVPVLSAGNWGGLGLHLRGNIEGFLGAGSSQKWLELHGGTHYESFYKPRWIELQRQFFDRFLKGTQNGWERRKPVMLHVRHPDKFEYREEAQWPLPGTQWTRWYLDAGDRSIHTDAAAGAAYAEYQATGDGVEFRTSTLSHEIEVTGPLSARLWVEASAQDADLFLTLRLYDPEGKEVTFEGASEAAVPVTQGWLRLSHRQLDPGKSTPYRPFHEHGSALPVEAGACYSVEVELWPTSIVVPAGYRLGLLVEGQDFSRSPGREPRTGSGPFLHNDPADRDVAKLAGSVRIHTGGRHDSSVLLPVIPPR
jgi:predicted acyl esterase